MPLVIRTICIFVAISLFGCGSKVKQAEPELIGGESWAGSMQGLAFEVKTLIPFVYDRKAYSAAQNNDVIKKALDDFGKRSHQVTAKMGEAYFGPDPILTYSVDSLAEDVQRARDAFSLGQKEYSRGVVKTVMNHCFRCHSMIKEGAQAAWDLSKIVQSPLKPTEKFDLLVASRRYPEAVKTMEGVLGDASFAQSSPFEFESSLRKYLALMLRAENNPQRALNELERILKSNAVPFYVREQAEGWRGSLQRWAKAPTKLQPTLKLGRQLVQRGGELQSYAKDHSGDIEYLRATTVLHEALRANPESAIFKAEAYWLLGQSYEVLDDLGYWNLHETYYDSCVRLAPKEKLARQCFARLESSVYMGFSGSSGVHIPESEKARLERLKALLN